MADSYKYTNRIWSTSGMRVFSTLMHIMELYLMGFRYSIGMLLLTHFVSLCSDLHIYLVVPFILIYWCSDFLCAWY